MARRKIIKSISRFTKRRRAVKRGRAAAKSKRYSGYQERLEDKFVKNLDSFWDNLKYGKATHKDVGTYRSMDRKIRKIDRLDPYGRTAIKLQKVFDKGVRKKRAAKFGKGRVAQEERVKRAAYKKAKNNPALRRSLRKGRIPK